MALKSTIFKADIQIADMDRHYYADHQLTIALHPSETEERMMVRLLGFMCFAHADLTLAKGLSDVDEPDLWQKNLTDDVLLWIDVGQVDETRIKKASNKAEHAVFINYLSTAADWWQSIHTKLSRFTNISVYQLNPTTSEKLAQFAQRTMRLQCNIQDGHVWLSDDTQSLEIVLNPLAKASR